MAARGWSIERRRITDTSSDTYKSPRVILICNLRTRTECSKIKKNWKFENWNVLNSHHGLVYGFPLKHENYESRFCFVRQNEDTA
jgi:hypothetical protein